MSTATEPLFVTASLQATVPRGTPPLVERCSSFLHGCPCGFHGDTLKECRCSSSEVTRYTKRISGPLLDRIDIFVEVPRVEYEKLADETVGETSQKVRARVEAARQVQRERFNGRDVACNADATALEVREFCQVEPSAQSLLRDRKSTRLNSSHTR